MFVISNENDRCSSLLMKTTNVCHFLGSQSHFPLNGGLFITFSVDFFPHGNVRHLSVVLLLFSLLPCVVQHIPFFSSMITCTNVLQYCNVLFLQVPWGYHSEFYLMLEILFVYYALNCCSFFHTCTNRQLLAVTLLLTCWFR